MAENKRQDIITVPSLQSYFFESLTEINRNLVHPLPEKALYYSSDVLEKFSISSEYFETEDGKVREKILGEKFLMATSKSFEEQKRIYKDIGDTSLILCGYFSDSISKKIVDRSYYKNLGVTAYKRLNSVVPSLLDMPSFFEILAYSFDGLTQIISEVASRDQSDPQKHLVVDRIIRSYSKKAS
ncbi:MAG: hypothetical protein JNM93_03900 [Bacteriovoracaceae bacterium]|nr:hypothetical protein [Bacteriovoracaceae bacterium]